MEVDNTAEANDDTNGTTDTSDVDKSNGEAAATDAVAPAERPAKRPRKSSVSASDAPAPVELAAISKSELATVEDESELTPPSSNIATPHHVESVPGEVGELNDTAPTNGGQTDNHANGSGNGAAKTSDNVKIASHDGADAETQPGDAEHLEHPENWATGESLFHILAIFISLVIVQS